MTAMKKRQRRFDAPPCNTVRRACTAEAVAAIRVDELNAKHAHVREHFNGVWLNLVRALRSGRRDWWFKSTHPDCYES